MSKKGFELLDHPADMGILVWAESIQSLFEESVAALCSVLIDLDQIELKDERSVEINAASTEEALYQVLSEVLFFFDAEKYIFPTCTVKFMRNEEGIVKLLILLAGEKLVQQRHHLKTYVKAITFHQMQITEENGEFKAQVYLDI